MRCYLRGCSVLERCSPTNPALCSVLVGKDRERTGGTPTPGIHLDTGNGKSQSDRGQVIGGKLLIGQLAPWVTWDI